MNKKKLKKLTLATGVALGSAFVSLSLIAKKKKGESVYDNDPGQKNSMSGKRVKFVKDDTDDENADGIKGHLIEVGLSGSKADFYGRYVKRGIDITLSFVGLVVLSPLYAGIALAIKIDDPGPVFFTQKRVGQNKEYFKLHKFRSMKMSTPHDVPTHMLENPEQYITRVGKFLRKYSLDELPQIWDIFIGNMSVIGPRPGLWNQDLLIAERDKYGANDVKPGLTGWAQINGRDELEIPDKAKLDGEYVEKQSFLFDVKCFFGTMRSVAGAEGVVEGGTGVKDRVNRHYTDGKTDQELIGNIGFSEAVTVDTNAHKRVLVTGAGSYIGEKFREYAAENYGHNLEIDEVDMLDPSWREFDFSPYDIVYHVAGIAHADVGNVSDEVKEKYYAVNTDLAVEVAEKTKDAGVKEFIFMSSMIVYGESAPYGKPKVVAKASVPKPANFYGDSKLQADVAVRDLADENFKVIVLRPPMIYGKGSKGNYPTLAKLARKLPVFPKVDNERSMLYIGNLCEFLCQIMLVKSPDNSVVLLPQNGEWSNTGELVQEIAEANGKRLRRFRILNPAVLVGSKVPGKIGALVNKAFGNNCYAHGMSIYEGIDYQNISLRDSIKKIESIQSTASTNKTANRVCIINCFDTYEHRVDLLHNYFKSTGAQVQIYTSDYLHFEKCKRTDSKEDFIFFNTIPYTRNISFQRLKSHMILAKNIFKEIEKHDFDLLWILIPPNSFVKKAAKYKKKHRDVKIIFDILDLWPETMPIFKFKDLPPFRYWQGLRNKHLDAANEIVIECNLYETKLPQSINREKIHTIYLARERKEFHSKLNLPEDRIALCYLGSINNIIDITAISDLIMKLKKYKPVQIHIVGDGEKKNKLIEACKLACAEVIYHGKVYDVEEKRRIFDSCHYGLNIMKKSVFVGLTMKSIDYFEAGLPIINNIKGDTWDIVEKEGIGFDLTPSTDFKKVALYEIGMRKRARAFFENNLSIERFEESVKTVK